MLHLVGAHMGSPSESSSFIAELIIYPRGYKSTALGVLGSATKQSAEDAAALSRCGLGVATPLLGTHAGLDLRDVLAAAGPGGLAARVAGDCSAHGNSS